MPWLFAYSRSHVPAGPLGCASRVGRCVGAGWPGRFGNVLSQSGAFWRGNEASNDPPYEWLTGQYAASSRKNVRFYLDVGALESRGALGGAAPSILDANRRLRDALRKKGYRITYEEVPGGTHSPESWRRGLPAAIAALARN